ncbi:MAG: radical SAM protein [Planctomycetes bacterium]|nr:radical SAM protein [Planctomycetota bacterium]
MANRCYLELCYTCNSRCLSCPTPWEGGILPFDKIKEFLDDKVQPGTIVAVNGGEPTIHPDFINIIAYAHKLGAHLSLLTNGRRFSDREFADASVKAGLYGICIPLHGPNEEIHEQLTRSKGSFTETVAGIKNILGIKTSGAPVTVTLKLLISKINIERLPETVRFVDDEFPGLNLVMLCAMDIVCKAEENKDKLLLTLTEAVPYVAQAVEIGLAKGLNLQLKDIPPCIFPNPEFYYPVVYQTQPEESQVIYGPTRYQENFLLDGTAVKAESCRQCEADKFCAGVWESYAQVVGFDELKPIKNLKPPFCIRR